MISLNLEKLHGLVFCLQRECWVFRGLQRKYLEKIIKKRRKKVRVLVKPITEALWVRHC